MDTTHLVVAFLITVVLFLGIALAIVAAEKKPDKQVPNTIPRERELHDVLYLGYPEAHVIDGLEGSFKHGSPYVVGINYLSNTLRLVDTGFSVRFHLIENLAKDLESGKSIEFETHLIGHDQPHDVRFVPHETISTATLEINPRSVSPTLRVNMHILQADDLQKLLTTLQTL
jgi:hypothetical protein